MKKSALVLITAIIFASTSAIAEKNHNSAPAAHTQQASPEKKKIKSLFMGVFAIFDKVGTFVQGKYKQNERAIEDAEKGIHSTTKRQMASDPAARRVQEKLEKITQEKINKYDSVGE